MSALSAELRFDEAQVVKEKYDLIEKYKAKSVIVNPALHEIDVFSYDEDEGVAFVNYMHVRGGSIVQSITIEYKKKLDESASEILSNYVPDSEVGLRRLLYRFCRSLILLTLNLSFRKGGIRENYSRYRSRM